MRCRLRGSLWPPPPPPSCVSEESQQVWAWLSANMMESDRPCATCPSQSVWGKTHPSLENTGRAWHIKISILTWADWLHEKCRFTIIFYHACDCRLHTWYSISVQVCCHRAKIYASEVFVSRLPQGSCHLQLLETTMPGHPASVWLARTLVAIPTHPK